MEYKVIEKDGIFLLEIEVNKLIAQGWRPLGGVAINNVGFPVSYAQAMIREQNDD